MDGRLPRRSILNGMAGLAAFGVAGAASTTAYGDETIEVTRTSLGPAVTALGFNNAARIGAEIWLVSSRMQPAVAACYDLTQQRVTRVVELPDVVGCWGAEALGTDLYIATFTPGRLIRIDTVTATITDSVDLGEEVAWNVKASPDGRLFVGTYGHAELWEYDPATRTATNHGRMHPTDTYVRDVAATESHVYCGIGSHPGLIAFDRATGSMTDIMPPEFSDLTFVSVCTIVGDKLVVGATPQARVAVIDLADPTTYDIIIVPNDEPFVTGLYGEGNDVWVGTTKSNAVWHLTIGETTLTQVAVGTSGTKRMGRLDDTHLWLCQNTLGILDLTTGVIENPVLESTELQPSAEKPQSLQWADGRVFVGGSGVIGIHDDHGREPLIIGSSPGEAKDFAAQGNQVYAGVYTLALFGAMSTNQTKLERIGRVPSSEEQTRPLSIALDRRRRWLLMGTEPDYGRWEGSFACLDLRTGEVRTWRGILSDQSVAAVCPERDGAFLGGSIVNGYGTTPTRAEASLAYFSHRSSAVEREVDLAGVKKVVDLQIVRKILVASTDDGTLLGLDPSSLETLWSVKPGTRGGRLALIDNRLFGTDGATLWSTRIGGRQAPAVQILATDLGAQLFGEPVVTTDGDRALFAFSDLDLVRFDLG